MRTLLSIFLMMLATMSDAAPQTFFAGQIVGDGSGLTNLSGVGTLATNANQFGASTTLTIKSGALVTNLNIKADSGASLALTINTNVLVVTNGLVGIGTNSPVVGLHIGGTNVVQIDGNKIRSSDGRNFLSYSPSPTGSQFGFGAGNATVTGNRNFGMGYQALNSISSGTDNLAIGSDGVGYSITTGIGNVLLGSFTGENIVDGARNVGVGYGAMNAMVSVSAGVGVGAFAGNILTNGDYNTFVGHGAARQMINGRYNTILGGDALRDGQFVNESVGVGVDALMLSTDSYNAAVGTYALQFMHVGTYNAVLGYQAGIGVLAGHSNVIIGAQAILTNGSGNILIGVNADALGTNANYQMNVGNTLFATGLGTGAAVSTAGKIGIGTIAPSSALDVPGEIRAGSATLTNTTFTTINGTTLNIANLNLTNPPANWLVSNAVGNSSVIIKAGNLSTVTGHAGIIFRSYLAGSTDEYPGQILLSPESGANGRSLMRFSTSTNGILSYAMAINGAGFVGIGTTNPTTLLDIQGEGGLKIGASGGVLTNILYASATLDFPSTAAGADSDLPITVAGASDGDIVSLGKPSASIGPLTGLYSSWASNGVVYVRFANNNLVTAQDPASGVFKVRVDKFK